MIRRLAHAFVMCQSMFCALPCPSRIWDAAARPLMLLFLPVVGLEIGLIWAALALAGQMLCLPPLILAVILTACPFALTGAIHLDGFMDVTDAVRSYRDLEARRAILKDPHVGSFAVIGCILLMLAMFACLVTCVSPGPAAAGLSAAIPAAAGPSAEKSAQIPGNLWILLLIPALSRCCSALAVTGLPAMATSQYQGQEKSRLVMAGAVVMAAVLTAVGFLAFGRQGFCLAGVLAGYGLALLRGYRSLKGMNGDLAGYALTIGELCGVAVLALMR